MRLTLTEKTLNFMNRQAVFKKDKAVNAILYVAHKLERSDIHKICKILYFADQKSLSECGRSITGDTYIAMNYGPVPSYIEDIFKAVRHQSYFSQYAKEFEGVFSFQNDYILKAEREPDMQHLSKSDVECLDYAIAKCKDLDFAQLTLLSHGYAWSSTAKDRPIAVEDILKEAGDTDDYINYVTEMISLERAVI